MRWLSRLVTIGLIGAVVAGGVWLAATMFRQRQVGASFKTWAMFRDASLLPVGSRVVIAGVHVGEIVDLAIEGRLARVSMRLRNDVVLWDDAWAEKKAASLFGDGYVEVHPGGPGPGRRQLASGEPIPRVVEGVSTDRTLRELDQAMPRLQGALVDTEVAMVAARRVINGALVERLEEVDHAVRAQAITAPLRKVDDAMTQLDDWTARAQARTGAIAPELYAKLDGFADDVATATAGMRDGRAAFAGTLAEARTGMDDVDAYVADVGEIVARLDGTDPPEDQGTLERLIHDPELGEDLHEATEGVADALRARTQLQTVVGLRSEYNLWAREPRFYVTAEIGGRGDSFYLLELEKGPIGGVPDIDLSNVGGSPDFTRNAAIYDKLRFTAQWGTRQGWASFRFGFKESTFGAGADALLMSGRLKLSADLYGPSFGRVPRLKIAAALQVFKATYILMGIDDALQTPGELDIEPWPAGADEPQRFERVRYGRDGFVGLMLHFDEKDLNSILTIYGAAILSIL